MPGLDINIAPHLITLAFGQAHIVDLVFSHTALRDLQPWRATCKAFKKRVDRRLVRHLVMTADDGLHTPFGALPPLWDWAEVRDALEILDTYKVTSAAGNKYRLKYLLSERLSSVFDQAGRIQPQIVREVGMDPMASAHVETHTTVQFLSIPTAPLASWSRVINWTYTIPTSKFVLCLVNEFLAPCEEVGLGSEFALHDLGWTGKYCSTVLVIPTNPGAAAHQYTLLSVMWRMWRPPPHDNLNLTLVALGARCSEEVRAALLQFLHAQFDLELWSDYERVNYHWTRGDLVSVLTNVPILTGDEYHAQVGERFALETEIDMCKLL